MKLHIKITFYVLLFFSIIQEINAQNNWENDGEIEDVEIEIVKNREIKLPTVSRNFEKISPLSSLGEKVNLTYFYNTLNFKLSPIEIRTRPLRIKEEKLEKFYGNYIKGGFGNYVTPYFEGYVNSKRNKQYTYGAHVNYLNSKNGPVDNENSGSGVFDFDVFGKLFGKNATLGGDLSYKRNKYHFYGYDQGAEVSADSIEQIFNRFSFDLSLNNSKVDNDFDYSLGLSFNHLSDNYNAVENLVKLDASVGYKFSEGVSAEIHSDMLSAKQEDELFTISRNLVRVKPRFNFNYQDFKLSAGFNLAYEDDSLGKSDDLHFFPYAEAKYPFSSVLELYAGITGDVNSQTLNNLTSKNPFLQNNQLVFHDIKTFDFYGGARGKLNNDIGYHAGFSLANIKNINYFINSPSDLSRFLSIYDTENTAVVNIFGELTMDKNNFKSTFRADYWGYGANESIGGEAWHRPNYLLTLTSSYNLFDKILFNSSLYGIGGIKAINTMSGEEINLDAAFDLSLKADYLISKQVSVFASVNNIFGQEYELLYRYPVRKIQFLAGLTYSF